MRKLFTILAVVVSLLPVFLHAEEPARESVPMRRRLVVPASGEIMRSDTVGRPKVAVVLSGGGAKGVAHVGALRIIEAAGIPVDIVVGTSMGAIVGSLYSVGYTPDQLESMIMAQDWGLLMSDRTERRAQSFLQKESDARYQVSFPFGKKLEAAKGLIEGTNLEMLFNDLLAGYRDSIDFNRLPIPFACVATELVTGRQVVFHEGVLPQAMRASMAIPGVFTPVYLDDMVLVDGGVVNNFPTDVARDMGADIIIGVDVQSALKEKNQLVGATAILGQILDISMQRQSYRSNVRLADIYVKVDVEGYSTASFNLPALDSLMQRGEESTLDKWDDLTALKHKMGVGKEFVPLRAQPFVPLSERGDFFVHNVSFAGLSPRQTKWVMRQCRLRENSEMNVEALEHCMSVLGATMSHSNIYYSLRDTLDGYNLHFHMDEIKDNSISAGVRFDTEEIASVIVNGTFRLGKKVPMVASLTGRFGKRLMADVDYSFLTSPLSSVKLNYTFRRKDLNIYSGGKRYYNPTFNQHLAGLSVVNMNFVRQSLRMELGFNYQKFIYTSWLTDYRRFEHEGTPLAVEDDMLLSYFGRLDYETLDSRYFTRRGTALTASYELYTDNFIGYKGHAPFSAIAVSWMTAIPVSRRFSLIPSLYGRVISGTDIPFSMLNMVGGNFFGRYMPHQMPFDGIGYMEAAPHTFIAAKLQARQRIARRHYVSGSFNYALADNNFFSLLKTGKNYFGASLDYGYDLRSFPLMVSLGWSNITRSVSFYFQAGYMF